MVPFLRTALNRMTSVRHLRKSNRRRMIGVSRTPRYQSWAGLVTNASTQRAASSTHRFPPRLLVRPRVGLPQHGSLVVFDHRCRNTRLASRVPPEDRQSGFFRPVASAVVTY